MSEKSEGLEHQEVSSFDLVGRPIVSQDGRRVGEVVSVLIDVKSWRVLALDARLRRDVLADLSLKRPLLGSQTITIPTEEISGVKDSVVLRSRLGELTFGGGKPLEVKEPNQG